MVIHHPKDMIVQKGWGGELVQEMDNRGIPHENDSTIKSKTGWITYCKELKEIGMNKGE